MTDEGSFKCCWLPSRTKEKATAGKASVCVYSFLRRRGSANRCGGRFRGKRGSVPPAFPTPALYAGHQLPRWLLSRLPAQQPASERRRGLRRKALAEDLRVQQPRLGGPRAAPGDGQQQRTVDHTSRDQYEANTGVARSNGRQIGVVVLDLREGKNRHDPCTVDIMQTQVSKCTRA